MSSHILAYPTISHYFKALAEIEQENHRKYMKFIRNMDNLARSSPETLHVRQNSTHNAHNTANVSKAVPKAAKVYQKSPQGIPKDSQKAPKKINNSSTKHAKKDHQNESQTEART